MNLRYVSDLEQRRAGADMCARRGIARRDDSTDRRTHEEQSARGARSSAAARRLVLRDLGVRRTLTREGLLLDGAGFLEPLLRRRAGGDETLGTLAIAYSKLHRDSGLGARLFELRQIAGRGRWRKQSRELLALRHCAARRQRRHLEQAPVDRRHDLSGAAGTRGDRGRHANRFADRALLGDHRTEIERPLLLLEKADAFRFRRCGLGRLTGRLLIGMHDDTGNAMRICEQRRLQHNHQFASPDARGLDVDAENAWPRWRVDTERLGRRASAFQSDLHLPRRHRLETADVCQMDGKPRRLPDDERRILRKQFGSAGPPRHGDRLELRFCKGGRLFASARPDEHREQQRAQHSQGHNVSPTARSSAICARRAASRMSIARTRARAAVRCASRNSRMRSSPSV